MTKAPIRRWAVMFWDGQKKKRRAEVVDDHWNDPMTPLDALQCSNYVVAAHGSVAKVVSERTGTETWFFHREVHPAEKGERPGLRPNGWVRFSRTSALARLGVMGAESWE